MFPEFGDADYSPLRINKHTPFKGQPPHKQTLNVIDFGGNFEPTSTQFSEISLLSGE